jgi:hypothetical protein
LIRIRASLEQPALSEAEAMPPKTTILNGFSRRGLACHGAVAKAGLILRGLAARLEAAPFQNHIPPLFFRSQ